MLKIMSLNRWTSIEQFEFFIKMKTIVFLAVIAFAFAEPEYYNVAVLDKLSKDPLEWKMLTDCMLDRAPCSSVYAPYRAIVQDTVETVAAKCNPEQKRAFWKFLQKLVENSPEDYASFRRKYDPRNKYFDILQMILYPYSN